MVHGRCLAAAAAGDLPEKKGVETTPDAVQGDARVHGSGGGAATAWHGSVAAVSDLEEKELARSKSGVVPQTELKS